MRWLRWRFRCHQGRDCARIEFGPLECEEGDELPPPGSYLVSEYMCGSCGTRYRSTALVGNGGAVTAGGRERIVA